MGGFYITDDEIELMRNARDVDEFIGEYRKHDKNFPVRKVSGLFSMWKKRTELLKRVDDHKNHVAETVSTKPQKDTQQVGLQDFRPAPTYELGVTVKLHGNEYMRFAVVGAQNPRDALTRLKGSMRLTTSGDSAKLIEQFITDTFPAEVQ